MIWKHKIPNQGKRVLMLTPDVIIDRRILIEAKTLIKEGYEVYLLAGWDGVSNNLYEIEDGIKIERIEFNGVDERLKLIFNIKNKAIKYLNSVSTHFDHILGKQANFLGAWREKTIKYLNTVSTHLDHILGKNFYFSNSQAETRGYIYTNEKNQFNLIDWLLYFIIKDALKLKNLALRLVAKGISIIIKVALKLKNLTIRLVAKGISIIVQGSQGSIQIILKLKNLTIRLVAKGVHFSNYCLVKIFPIVTRLDAYESLLFNKILFYRPDIVHVHDLPMLTVGTKVKKVLDIPLIYDMHEFYPEQNGLTASQQKILRKKERKNIKYADICITVNSMLANEISKNYDYMDIKVIQNAMIIDPTFHNNKYDKFREEYSIKKEDIILLYQGWISPNRNLQNLVKGLVDVKQPIKLVIMGYGEFQQELKKIADELGISHKVIFVPKKTQQELLYYTASADIGIIPYPYKLDPNTKYSSPNKLYEFIAARIPIICNVLPFVSSIVDGEKFGRSYEMDSPKSIAQALNNFPYKKLDVFKSNLEKLGDNYLWQAEAPKLLEIYRNF